VAKRADAPYTTGRSHNWLKLKCDASQELVIGGWTDPKGTRQYLGAILVGYHDAGGALRYAGKVGSGFDHATLELLHEQLVERGESPFADSPRMRDAHWSEPTLVANVAFTEWTADGKLRHPRLQGLRPDKTATEVVREHPA
jgi:bifunctional non-homologous end joining protein LigD